MDAVRSNREFDGRVVLVLERRGEAAAAPAEQGWADSSSAASKGDQTDTVFDSSLFD